jgi:hypothetical protein
MKDIHKHSDEMRTDAGELVVVLKGVATDMATEEGLARRAETAFGPAPKIDEATPLGAPIVAYAESQTVEFWNWVPAADRKQAEAAADAVSNNEEAGGNRGQASVAVHEQILVANQEHPAQLYRRLPWLSVIILVAIAGAYAIANNGTEQGWSSVPVVESKPGPSAEPREELKPAIAAAEPLKDPQPVEPEERALTSEQIAVPPAPLDHIEEAGTAGAQGVTNLKNASAEIVEPTARRSAGRPPRHQKSVVNLHRGDSGRVCLWCSRSAWLQSFRLIDYFAWHPKYRRRG